MLLLSVSLAMNWTSLLTPLGSLALLMYLSDDSTVSYTAGVLLKLRVSE